MGAADDECTYRGMAAAHRGRGVAAGTRRAAVRWVFGAAAGMFRAAAAVRRGLAVAAGTCRAAAHWVFGAAAGSCRAAVARKGLGVAAGPYSRVFLLSGNRKQNLPRFARRKRCKQT